MSSVQTEENIATHTSLPLTPSPFRPQEFLLPGVSDSATIIFTILHQAPTRVVCLGQALVDPRVFSRTEEHVRTVPLTKQQVGGTIQCIVGRELDERSNILLQSLSRYLHLVHIY